MQVFKAKEKTSSINGDFADFLHVELARNEGFLTVRIQKRMLIDSKDLKKMRFTLWKL